MKASGRFISSTEIVPRDVQKKAQCVVFTPFLRDPWNDVKFIKNSCEAGPALKMKDSFQREVYSQPNERNATAYQHCSSESLPSDFHLRETLFLITNLRSCVQTSYCQVARKPAKGLQVKQPSKCALDVQSGPGAGWGRNRWQETERGAVFYFPVTFKVVM